MADEIRLANPFAPDQANRKKLRDSRLRTVITALILISCVMTIMMVMQSSSKILDSYVGAIDAGNWERLADLTSTEHQQEVRDFYSNPANEERKNGFFNVDSAQVSLANELDREDAANWVDLSAYEDRTYGEDLHVYLLGITMEVAEEGPRLYDGLNLFLAVTVKEKLGWSVAQLTPVPSALIERDLEKALKEDNPDVHKALDMAKEREARSEES